MGYTKRNCDNCNKEYLADNRNLKRGWGLCCSKSCAASKREKSKPNYNPERVKLNNAIRADWNNYSKIDADAPNVYGGSGRISGYTSEGYRVMDGVAYDRFDHPVYRVDIDEDGYNHGQWDDL